MNESGKGDSLLSFELQFPALTLLVPRLNGSRGPFTDIRTDERLTDRVKSFLLNNIIKTNTERRGQRDRKFGMCHGFCKISRTATEAN